VVAHFHYVLVPARCSRPLPAVYYWLPKWTGHMYDETLGQVAFLAVDRLGQHAFFPQHFLGLAGMPRRIPDYALQFADFNHVSTIGGFGFGEPAAVPVS
jgi:cytochrome c oxidase subunit 1